MVDELSTTGGVNVVIGVRPSVWAADGSAAPSRTTSLVTGGYYVVPSVEALASLAPAGD